MIYMLFNICVKNKSVCLKKIQIYFNLLISDKHWTIYYYKSQFSL